MSGCVNVQLLVAVVFVVLPCSLSIERCAHRRCHRMRFELLHRRQRSTLPFVQLENVFTRSECAAAARGAFGMAFNYAPLGTRHRATMQAATPTPSIDASADEKMSEFTRNRNRSRLAYWQQPEEFFNCHILQCPVDATRRALVNDNRFDYYSAYAHIQDTQDICVPSIGIFQLHITPTSYQNASLSYRANNVTSRLAHVVSLERTNALAALLTAFQPAENVDNITNIPLAYVGLYHDRARSKTRVEYMNEEREQLNCFLFRAWARGHPKEDAHCVALSRSRSWMSVECTRKLPFICEVFTLA